VLGIGWVAVLYTVIADPRRYSNPEVGSRLVLFVTIWAIMGKMEKTTQRKLMIRISIFK